jgi:PAS domain S-box-containing protein
MKVDIGDPEIKRARLLEIKREVERFENILDILKSGDKKLGAEAITYEKASEILDGIVNTWYDNLKPALFRILDLPAGEAGSALDEYDLMIKDYVERLNVLVNLLEENNRSDTRRHVLNTLYFIALFLTGAIFIVYYIRNSIVVPLLKLRQAASQIERGDFDIKAVTTGRDEIGELFKDFRRMAQTLRMTFDEKTRLLMELDILASFPEKNPYPIIECDMDCNIIYMNPAARRFADELEIDGIELLPQNIRDIASELKVSDKEVEYREMAIGQIVFGEYIHIMPDRDSIRVYTVDITKAKKAEKEIRKREASLAEAQRIARLGNWEWNIVTNELWWSDEIYRIFGVSPMQFKATYETFLDLVHPDDRDLVKSSIDKALYENEPYSIDHRIRLPDGSERVVHEQAETQFDEEGNAVRMLGMVQDITERKEAEEKLMEYSRDIFALADSSNVISAVPLTEDLYSAICNIAIKNFNLKMAWIGLMEEGSYDVKPVAQSGFEAGYLSTVKIKWDDSPAGNGPTGIAIKTKGAAVMNNISTDPAYAVWRLDAIKREYRSSMAVSLIDSEANVIGVLNLYSSVPDFFSKRKQRLFYIFANYAAVAIENRTLIEDLEEKVRDRTREIEVAKFEAEAASRAKSDFLSNMSHELRTPLNSIIGFSEMMFDGMAGPINEKQKDFLGEVIDSAGHLLLLINDILDLSKIEAGKMRIRTTEIDLKGLTESSLSMFREKMIKHNIKAGLEIDGGIGNIVADEMKIKQVLCNLLSNALKFTPDGGTVGVSVRNTRICTRKTGPDDSQQIETGGNGSRNIVDAVEFSVRDTGPGINEDDMERLFQPFEQLENSHLNKHEGTGLGLALCKRIVELHGGRIWVESEAGKGSDFKFIIPVKVNNDTGTDVSPSILRT